MISFSSEHRFVVTGASSGIGEGVALLLNQLGARVIAVGRNTDRLEAAKGKCVSPERFHVEPRDLAADVESLPAFMKELKEKYGKLRGVAYCAGITQVMPLKALTYADMKAVFDVDYFAPIFMAKGFCDKRINDGEGSSFVAIASNAAIVQDPGMTSYTGAKAGLVASMKSIAKEAASRHVRVNCISPAMVNTPMAAHADDYADVYTHKYPFGFAEVEDVANMVAFLLSDKSKWISGQNYIMDCASY